MRKNVISAIMLLAIAGCSTAGTTQLKLASARPEHCELDVYASKEEITRPWETVCMIDSRTGTTAFHTKTASAAIDHAKPHACECGADAILIDSMDTEGVTLGTWGRGKAILQGIRYK